jgi:alkylation response protein AidB-like acyl-CoA dehydrogenase
MDFDLTPAQEAFRRSVQEFAREVVAPRAAAIDASGEFPFDLVEAASTRGLAGVTIPSAWGGAARDMVSYALAIEEIAYASATLAVILAVTNSLVAEVVGRFGTETQRRRWLPELCSGRVLGAFALSEEQAGTDAANQQTRAIEEGDGYLLRGRKVWVANAVAARLVLIFAATTPGIGGRGVTAFLVPMDSPGLRRGPVIDSLGVRGLGCADLDLHDVYVPADSRLGAPGEGFRIALWALDVGRIAIAAQALGVGRAALDEALGHARRRQTFGQPIARYQAVQWMLVDMATELDAARWLTLKAAVAKDRQARFSLEAAMAKLLASEAAHRAADKALQILASAGYRRGATVERLFRDARATEIYQGTSEVQRMVIASRLLAAER